MISTPAYAAQDATAPLAPFRIERRAPRAHEVQIDIAFCGVCHSDLHQARNEWGRSMFPMVPGHEITGQVREVGSAVEGFAVGDPVGVGCFVDSCRECSPCRDGQQQYCERGFVATYNGREYDGTPTFGGYSTRITVDYRYVLRIPPALPLDRTAPLLCAGITTWDPLRRFGVRAGHRVAVVGLGGLGHVAVKLARAMGAEVTVLSTSPAKRADALSLGADAFEATSDASAFKRLANRFDLILDCVSAQHDYNAYLATLALDGRMVLLGIPDAPTPVAAFALMRNRRSLSGSLMGGIAETQAMLDFCAEHGVSADIERIPIADINRAYERMLRGDVRFRFVIDCASFGAE